MARVPDRTRKAPSPGAAELVITAAEWEAMLLEDPQADPGWKDAWPYGSWRWRLSGRVQAQRPRLAAPPEDPDPAAPDGAASGS